MMVSLLPCTKVYGGRLKDRQELLASSSGGAFTALSDIFLSAGGAVVCSSYNYESHQQEYKLITTAEERNAARGSKYMQSIPGDIFIKAKKWLEDNPDNDLLFVGTGCQAAGFKSYAEMCGLRDRVTVVDIICHGSPSPMLWREYAKSLETNGKIENLTFKDKRNGWNHPTAVVTIGGKEVSIKPYVKIFYSKKALRLSCHKCPYSTTERATDITIGDFWHIEEKMPDKFDEMGTSLFLIHTDRGEALFEKAKGSFDWFESNTADCWQENLEKPTPIDKDREKFWQDYYSHDIEYIAKKYGTVTFVKRIKRKIGKIIRKIRK